MKNTDVKQIALFLIVLTTLLPGFSATAQQTPAADRVTMYTFSDGLSDQLQELAGNPLLHRYAQTRERLSSGKYRPLYHFSAPEGRPTDSAIGTATGICSTRRIPSRIPLPIGATLTVPT